MVTPQQAPELHIPKSSNTATVRVIDSTLDMKLPSSLMFENHIEGHDIYVAACWVFLVSNATGTRHVLFDLGMRKDVENFPPTIQKQMASLGPGLVIKKNIADILDESPANGIPKTKDIEAIVWSHHHPDHTGDPSTFPSSTTLVVGPGFKKAFLPGYPADENSTLPSSDWEGRTLHEIDFTTETKGSKIGQFSAYDFFGDGSFYLLDTPGHAIGHMCGLARVTPTSFIFMGGDACHHPGEFRPTPFLPLPSEVPMSTSKKFTSSMCPGSLFEKVQPQGSATHPFYECSSSFTHDMPEALRSVTGMTEFDANSEVFTIIAHDSMLRDQIPFFPETINDWLEKDLDEKTRWLFLDDFAGAIDQLAE